MRAAVCQSATFKRSAIARRCQRTRRLIPSSGDHAARTCDLACLDETVRLGTRLGDGGALLWRLGAIVVRRGVDRQRQEIVILARRGLVVRTSHDRSLPRLDGVHHGWLTTTRMAHHQGRDFATYFRWTMGGALVRYLGVPAIAAAIARKSLFEQVTFAPAARNSALPSSLEDTATMLPRKCIARRARTTSVPFPSGRS